MIKPHRLGIWMDHQSANLIEFMNGSPGRRSIHSKFTHGVKEITMHEGEHRMHNKEQQQQAAYYKEICDIIKDYKSVLIFGPTEAGKELHNLLLKDKRYSPIQITVKHTDKMSENQQQAFVNDFFTTHEKPGVHIETF